MTDFYKVRFVFFFSLFFIVCTTCEGKSLNIVITNYSSLYFLNEKVQDISMKEMLDTEIRFIEDKDIAQSLSLGQSGDVLVTSNRKLCVDLAREGLANSFSIGNIFYDNLYCFGKHKQKTIVSLGDEYSNEIMSILNGIASSVNAEIVVIGKNEDVYQKISTLYQGGRTICGFLSVFANLNVPKESIMKTNYGIQYYACPLVGSNENAYQILMKSYEKKLHS